MAAIGAGRLEPGAAYSAAALADRLGAPTGAVHEAMTDLAGDGLVEPIAGGAFRISAPSPVELQEMIELRVLLEALAVRKVTDHGISDTELALLERLAAATLAPARQDDVLGYLSADLAFHLHLVELGGNRQLVEVVRILRTRSRLHGLDDEDTGPFMLENAREHVELVRLVGDGSVGAVDDLLRRHLSRTTARWPCRPEDRPSNR